MQHLTNNRVLLDAFSSDLVFHQAFPKLSQLLCGLRRGRSLH